MHLCSSQIWSSSDQATQRAHRAGWRDPWKWTGKCVESHQ